MAKPPKLLRYPLDIIDSTTDYMFIEVLEYTPGGLPSLSQSSSASFSTQLGAFMNKSKAIQSIILPMPNSVAAVNRTGWGESKISALAGAGLNAAKGLIDVTVGDQNLAGATTKVINDLNSIATGKGNEMTRNYVKAKGQTAIVNAIAGSNIQANQVLARQNGQIVNQNVELLFNSVSIRPFGFQFDFTPRNVEESKAVMQILKTFKKAAAAKRNERNKTNRTNGIGKWIAATRSIPSKDRRNRSNPCDFVAVRIFPRYVNISPCTHFLFGNKLN